MKRFLTNLARIGVVSITQILFIYCSWKMKRRRQHYCPNGLQTKSFWKSCETILWYGSKIWKSYHTIYILYANDSFTNMAFSLLLSFRSSSSINLWQLEGYTKIPRFKGKKSDIPVWYVAIAGIRSGPCCNSNRESDWLTGDWQTGDARMPTAAVPLWLAGPR